MRNAELKFNRKYYAHLQSCKTKKGAKVTAKDLRRDGWYIRVVHMGKPKHPKSRKWGIYGRWKGKGKKRR